MWERIKKAKLEYKINAFLIIFFSVGIAGLTIPATRNLFISLMPFSILLGIGLMFWVHKSWNTSQIFVFSIIVLLGYFVEVLGVATGIVFGDYFYGSALGPKLWGTPPMIGINWLMLIYCVYLLTRKMNMPVILQIIIGSALMVSYDVIMEPVAVKLDMWSWPPYDEIPLQNYIAWFAISAVMLTILHAAKIRYRNGVAIPLFFIQMGFFLVLGFFVN